MLGRAPNAAAASKGCALSASVAQLPNANAINYVRRAAPNLASLSPQKISNLDLEQGMCFVQTDDSCTDDIMQTPQALEIRPRCTLHGGATIRQVEKNVAATYLKQ